MIYLHIGRPKTGSSTIQNFLSKVSAKLDEQRQQVVSRNNFLQAIGMAQGDNTESRSNLARYRAVFKENAGTDFYISHEFMYDMRRGVPIDLIREVTSSHDVKIIVYLRDHPSLMVSHYNQSTKKGQNLLDFDSYAAEMKPVLSAIPSIRAWAEVFGWSSLRIRTLDPRSLDGGDLLSDFCGAVGLHSKLEVVRKKKRANTSEPWELVEIQRAAFRGIQRLDGRQGLATRAARHVLERLRVVCLNQKIPFDSRVQYLTPAQWRGLRDDYNNDLSILNAHIQDTQLPEFADNEPPPREYLPSIESFRLPLASKLAEIFESLDTGEYYERQILDGLRGELPLPGTKPSALASKPSRQNALVEL